MKFTVVIFLVCAISGASAFLGQSLALNRVQASSSTSLQMLFGSKKKAAPVKGKYSITVKQRGFTDFDLETEGTANLRKTLMAQKIDIYPLQGKLTNCGGGGVCGTCAVEVMDGANNLSPKAPNEKKVLSKKPENYRLSCCTRVSGACTVRTKP
uniref:2Fe-2S ferredoxin-type domain-containing protein n=1 Tax=Fibrocapsa japonica TaxID=94617 RepID=A0A7S2UXM9_9STRA|mmetsp:Transcript_13904/g.20514  ORF Transcript_13904/g.20514 Transcript_13904/m.20514 type:complete len:154 (+) Transcript_13904:134-595(+)